MNIRYSPSTGAFYPLDIDYGKNLPADIIAVSQSDFNVAMARPINHTFQFNASGTLVLTPPPALTLDQIKAAKLAEMSSKFSSAMGAIKAGYPPEEIESWSKQEAEARTYVADNKANTPLLSAMAKARDIAVADLSIRVIANADAWTTISGALIGKRQSYEDQVAAARDIETVAAITWAE